MNTWIIWSVLVLSPSQSQALLPLSTGLLPYLEERDYETIAARNQRRA